MIHESVSRWLHAPPLTGKFALACVLIAVAVPTGLRWLVDHAVAGCEFTPYVPFVLLSAVLMGWSRAAAVALGSTAVLGGLFAGRPMETFTSPCFVSSAFIFLASSAAVIGAVLVIRMVVRSMQSRGADERDGGIVFSLERGKVWASWYGQGPPLLLGSKKKVSTMMEDFLKQVETGERLEGLPKTPRR